MELGRKPTATRQSQTDRQQRVVSRSLADRCGTRSVPILGASGPAVVSGTINARIAALASLQRARITRQQLVAAGVTESAIARRLRNGQLVRVHRGVYALAGTGDLELADETAALLACGPKALLADHSAATLWEMRVGRARPVHVLVPEDSNGPRPDGVIVHRSRILLKRDARIHKGLPVTSPVRTILDIAARLPDREVRDAITEGRAKRVLTDNAIADILRRAGGHPGAPTLRRVVQRLTGTLTESKAALRLLELIQDAQLPLPKSEYPVLDYVADFMWRDLNLIVEVDGYDVHSTRAAFNRDRRRDARLHNAGYTVIRFSAAQIEYEPFAVIALLAQAIHAATASAA